MYTRIYKLNVLKKNAYKKKCYLWLQTWLNEQKYYKIINWNILNVILSNEFDISKESDSLIKFTFY